MSAILTGVNPISNALTPTHLILLMLALVFFFGAKRLPELGRSLGTGMREFKRAITSGDAITGSDGGESPANDVAGTSLATAAAPRGPSGSAG